MAVLNFIREKYMPILTVKVSGDPHTEKTKQMSELLIDCTTRILKKKPELISIVIDYIHPDNWIIAGKTLTEQGKNSFYFDIKITDETNTKDEKVQYIKETFAGFNRILNNLHEESYIHIHDVKAAAYGYGGHTQEYRYHNK